MNTEKIADKLDAIAAEIEADPRRWKSRDSATRSVPISDGSLYFREGSR